MTYRKLALTNVRVKSDFADSRQASPCTECAGRSAKSGNIHRDLHAVDLLKALVGVSYMATSPDWQQSAGRLVDILITGSRPIKWPPANTTPELSANGKLTPDGCWRNIGHFTHNAVASVGLITSVDMFSDAFGISFVSYRHRSSKQGLGSSPIS